MDLAAMKQYIEEQMPKSASGSVQKLLVLPFWEYFEHNFVSSTVIREQLAEAEARMADLTYKQQDEVMDCFYVMCIEYQRLAFCAGAQVGARLTLELMEKKNG